MEAGTVTPKGQAMSEQVSDVALSFFDGPLPGRVLAMCKARNWSLHWTARGAYLHLESSELIEAIRGKHGDPMKEAADVLLVLMSITEANGINWQDVVNQAELRTAELMATSSRAYPGEERLHERAS